MPEWNQEDENIKTRMLSIVDDQTIDWMQRKSVPFIRLMSYYKCAMMAIETKFNVLNEEYSLEFDRNPISSIKTRLKNPRSIKEKLERRGIPPTLSSIEENLNDIAGVRVICSFPEDVYYAAASHIDSIGPLHKFNELRLDMDDDSPYINSGVLLMNLSLLRKEQDYADVFHFIEKRKSHLILPDQDIISSLYGSRIYTLDPFRYNMTERLYRMHSPFEKGLDLNWVRKHSIIIHYCGRNKPWKENYIGDLDVFYKEAVAKLESDEVG